MAAIRNDFGDVMTVADDDPRATGDSIAASLQQQGMYQSPEGWAIVTGSPGGQLGGAPRVILDTNGKQPPADVLARFPMASPQEQQGFQQQAAKYRAGEGQGMSLTQAVLAGAGAYFGMQGLGGLLGGLGAAGGAAGGAGGLVSSPWAAPIADIGASPLTGMAGSVLDTVAPAATGWGSGVGTATAGAGAGGSMDFFDLADAWGSGTPNPAIDNLTDLGTNPNLGGGTVNFGSASDPFGLGTGGPTPTGSNGWDAIFNSGSGLTPGGPWNDFSVNPLGSGAGGGSSFMTDLLKKIAPGVLNPDGSVNLGKLAGGALNTGAGLLPGLAALNYANNQPGIDLTGLNSTIGQVGGMNSDSQQSVLQRMQDAYTQQAANGPAFVQSVTDPVQRNIASGYGALQQSQALRGLGGSSFGDTSLANYMDQGNRTLANAGATAAQAAGTLQNQNLGMQGTLASGIQNTRLAQLLGQGGLQQNAISLQNTAQKNKNDLFGRAFSGFGNALSGGGGGSGGIDWSKLLSGIGGAQSYTGADPTAGMSSDQLAKFRLAMQ